MTKASASKVRFRPLPTEPWGRRLLRAREDLAGLTLGQAAALAGHWTLVADSTISRLESLAEAPTGPRSGSRRALAYILCMAYEVDPAEFGLGPDDLPGNLVVLPRNPGDQAGSSTEWETRSHLRAVAS